MNERRPDTVTREQTDADARALIWAYHYQPEVIWRINQMSPRQLAEIILENAERIQGKAA